MSEEHSLKKWTSLNEAFKNYESTRAGITPKRHKKKLYKTMNIKKPKNLKKMLRKSPVSNV